MVCNQKRTRISTIIPCFNHGALLSRAVESVFAQQGALEVEAIVVDDGSTDTTVSVCEELSRKHPVLRVVRKTNGGLSSARNAGIRVATGEYLHFLDADDYVDPAAYERMISLLDSCPEAGVVYCGYQVIDLAGGSNTRSTGEPPPNDIRVRLLAGSLGPVHSFVVRRNAVVATGFFDESLTSCEDWDYWLRVAFRGFRFVHLPEVLVYYERGPANMSRNLPVMLRNANAVLAKAASYPKDDALESARTRGVDGLRQWFFEFTYGGVLATHLRAGNFGFVAKELAALVRQDTQCAWLFLSSLGRHKRAAMQGLGALLVRAVGKPQK